ncbi:Interferon alpha-1 [Labeo rohita]|uniref:Interferon alpha-1 n=1 Tax=Labeo rohita TaxID=84645 RepID=A0ABQ8LEX5_LABRO|nr:Interferon alpha-1 [Labeo rohita]
MSHQHLTASQLQLHSLENSTTTTAHKECTRHIKWGHLIQSLNSMGTAISHDCAFDYEETSLCDPHHLANMVDHDAILLVDIVKKTETMYKKNPNPKKFIEALHHTHHTLSNCVHHSDNAENEPVTTCFNKLEAFLKKKSQSHCAWEIINAKVREVLQRLEKRSVRRRR